MVHACPKQHTNVPPAAAAAARHGQRPADDVHHPKPHEQRSRGDEWMLALTLRTVASECPSTLTRSSKHARTRHTTHLDRCRRCCRRCLRCCRRRRRRRHRLGSRVQDRVSAGRRRQCSRRGRRGQNQIGRRQNPTKSPNRRREGGQDSTNKGLPTPIAHATLPSKEHQPSTKTKPRRIHARKPGAAAIKPR